MRTVDTFRCLRATGAYKATVGGRVAIILQRGCETLVPLERPMLDTDKAVVVASTLTTAAALLGVLAVYYLLSM